MNSSLSSSVSDPRSALAGPTAEPAATRAEFALPKTHFFGRDLAEYRRLFALGEDHALFRAAAGSGPRVLDVAAGPASFTAEATALGVRAVAVDPHYGARPDALATLVRADHARVAAQMRAKPGLFRATPEGFPTLENAVAARCAAAERFLADYEDGFVVGRYVGAALPDLPFADASFDLVLCGHLLFLHAGLFDADFHRAALRELLRVVRPGGEARLHPLCAGDGRDYPHLPALLAELAVEGVTNERVVVRGAFFHAADATLVLRRG